MTPMEALVSVEKATIAKAQAFFGKEPEDRHKRLRVLLHPDRHNTSPHRARFDEAFRKLEELFSAATGKVTPKPITIGKWLIEEPLAKGTIADLYSVRSKDGAGVMKIARAASDNDLMKSESEHLKFLAASAKGSMVGFARYLPQVKESVSVDGRRANIFGVPEGCALHSMEELRGMFPGGIEFRHIAWMGNRLFNALGYVHQAGFVHGGVTPDHTLFKVESHGLLVVGWCSSVAGGKKHIPLLADHWRGYYPPEVAAKRVATPAIDVFMAAHLLRSAAVEIPDRFKAFFEWCAAKSPAARPNDGWKAAEVWEKLAKEEYGAPKFVEFNLPKQ